MEKQSRTYVPAKTGSARAFVIPGGARQDRDIHYASFMKIGSGSQSLGEVTKIEIPSDVAYNSFIEVGQIQGSKERVTTQLVEKMPVELRSLIDRLARSRSNFDVHVQFGECLNPGNINEFSLGIVYEFATGSSHENDELIALDGGENAEIRETLSISARDQYKYVPLAYYNKESAAVINEILAVAVKRDIGCDDFPLMVASTKAEGGSPGTGPYVLFSIDNGKKWYSHAIDGFDLTMNGAGIDIVNNNIVVVSFVAGGLAYVPTRGFYTPEKIGWDPTFTKITTGFVGAPKAISSAGIKGFIIGANGYVYGVEEPSAGVTVLDDGSAALSQTLNAVHALDDKNVLAGGINGTLIFSTDGESFSASPSSPVGVGVTINTVSMRYADEWWVGTSTGKVYVTFDRGQNWTEVAMPGAIASTVNSIAWASHSVGYISARVTNKARVYRTICGGISWSVQPQQSTYSMPSAARFNQIAVNPHDVNFVLCGGLAVDNVDGALVVGSDAVT